MEPEYIERKALDKALTAAAAHGQRRSAFCTIYRLPTLRRWCTARTVPIGLRWVIAGTHATMGFCRQRIHMIFVATANETR